MPRRRQVLILSKFRLSGEALRNCLSYGEPGYRVLFRTCPYLGDLPADFSPELVVLDCGDCDLDCPGISLERRSTSKFIMIARSPGLDRQVQWLRAGIRGVVDEADSSPEKFRKAVCKVLDGEVWASRTLLSRVVAQSRGPGNDRAAVLTPRERQVADLMRQGLKNAAIAARLKITEKTVKGHVTNVFRKMGVENRTQAAVQLGLRASPTSRDETGEVTGSK